MLFNVLKPLFQEKTESSVGRSGDDKRANIRPSVLVKAGVGTIAERELTGLPATADGSLLDGVSSECVLGLVARIRVEWDGRLGRGISAHGGATSGHVGARGKADDGGGSYEGHCWLELGCTSWDGEVWI